MPDTDTDGDLTADCNETCDADPLKLAPGQCGCGIADTDTDGDLTADCNDTCLTIAANDVDGDTICGDVDNCPVDANADQADLDNDNIGNVCDTRRCRGSLLLSQVPHQGRESRQRRPRPRSHRRRGHRLARGHACRPTLHSGNVYVSVAAGAFIDDAAARHLHDRGRPHPLPQRRGEREGDRSRARPGRQQRPGQLEDARQAARRFGTASPTAPATVSLVQPTPSITRTRRHLGLRREAGQPALPRGLRQGR